MKHITWPAVALFIAMIAALAVIFVSADTDMRTQVLGYFDSLVPFMLGIAAGAFAGGAAGYVTGKHVVNAMSAPG